MCPSQMAIRGFAIPAVLDIDFMGQKSILPRLTSRRKVFSGITTFRVQIGSALDAYQFSANGKVYLTSSSGLRPFINTGIGGYKFRPGSTYVGGNFGAEILYNITPNWGLQGSYNFHAVNTPGAVTKFSTLQAGIRFVF